MRSASLPEVSAGASEFLPAIGADSLFTGHKLSAELTLFILTILCIFMRRRVFPFLLPFIDDIEEYIKRAPVLLFIVSHIFSVNKYTVNY
jgi:hypothetical protein